MKAKPKIVLTSKVKAKPRPAPPSSPNSAKPPRASATPTPAVAPSTPAGGARSADAAFDRMAGQHRRKSRVEPPCMILQGTDGAGNLWLGGLPTPDHVDWLLENGIKLLLSAMDKRACDAGGVFSPDFFQFHVPVGYAGAKRDDNWREARVLALQTLRAGDSVLAHCQAGKHRAPILAAALHSWMVRCPFQAAYETIKEFRTIDEAGVRNRANVASQRADVTLFLRCPVENLRAGSV